MTNQPTQLLKQFAARIRRFVSSDQNGVALIVSLLVMLVLVLLALSLVLQSQTEYVGSVNETDSLEALSHAEAGLEWFGRRIKDYLETDPDDFDDMLNGPDDADTASCGSICDDNLVGFRTIDKTLTSLNDLNSTNEKTTSIVYLFDWDDDGTTERFEAFRVGVDTDDPPDGNWDGPRAILYVRVDDNYDEGTTGVQNLDDLDYRIRVRLMADYPIFVDSSGVSQDPILAQRGTARRKLEGKVAPEGGIAIRTDGDFRGEGDIKVCGACGGIHANEDMEINGSGPQICYRATASGTYDQNASPLIQGDSGGGNEEEWIPIINPYDELYVPEYSNFNHATDTELSSWPELQCPEPSASDPGSSKYFAFVYKRLENQQQLQIYKAYWDFAGTSGANRWVWRLIDDNTDGTFTTLLDNCGRLVSGTDPVTSAPFSADPNAGPAVTDDVDIATTGDCWPACAGTDTCTPDGVIDACDGTNGDDDFYGWTGQGNWRTDTCNNDTGDETLTGTSCNDYAKQSFHMVTGTNIATATWTSTNGNSDVPALPSRPGVGCTSNPTGPDFDSQPDFIWSSAPQHNAATWKIAADTIFSPMYNAIVWSSGNLHFGGGSDLMQYYDVSDAIVKTTALPNDQWRITAIAYGRVEAAGSPKFSPAVGPGYEYQQFGMVAGRDVDLSGGPVVASEVCPDLSTDPGADCEAPNLAAAIGYEGIYLAHEQIELSGSPNIMGFMIAEDADFCIETNPPGSRTEMNGSPSIYYDCESPEDPWLSATTRVQSWEEIQ